MVDRELGAPEELANLRDELAQIHVRSESLEAVNRVLARENRALRQDLRAAREKSKALRREIAKIKSSTSWKFSRPVRAMGRLRRRGAKPGGQA